MRTGPARSLCHAHSRDSKSNFPAGGEISGANTTRSDLAPISQRASAEGVAPIQSNAQPTDRVGKPVAPPWPECNSSYGVRAFSKARSRRHVESTASVGLDGRKRIVLALGLVRHRSYHPKLCYLAARSALSCIDRRRPTLECGLRPRSI